MVTDVLAGLKGFQRKTVEYVFNRMYDDPDPATRFLVADEVGLGKTLVARGLIAKTIQRLQEEHVKRIDVIYICSNADIARQNIQRLNVTGRNDFSLASRITLLPLQLHRLNANGLNFISFTPGTSFNMSSRGGTSQERAVLFQLLKEGARRGRARARWRLSTPAGKQGRCGIPRRGGLGRAAGTGQRAHQGLITEFRASPDLRKRFLQISRRLRDPDVNVEWNTYWNVIRDLRQTLARGCVEALEPDFVILDEFQRFKELLDEPDPDDPDDIRSLAHHLFAQKDVRILLLSATPYKMYTLSDEPDDDHYADFLQTARFLMSKESAADFEDELRDFRRALLEFETIGEAGLRRRKNAVEKRLRRVMVRTERLAVTADRSGMLADRKLEARLEPNDVRAFAMVDRLSRMLSTNDPTDYWKSAPYLLNFMESYQLKQQMKASLAADGGIALADAIVPDLLLPRETLETYGALDPGNARLRGVIDDLLGSEAWRLLWMPPSLPYYAPGGPFANPAVATLTKRLIFSSWAVVPPAVSAILSYGAERQMMLSRDAEARNDAESRRRLRGLLTGRRVEGEPAGMSTFALLYPSPSLAELADPLTIARDLGTAGSPVSREELMAEAERRIAAAIAPLVKGAPTDGTVDERWYWAVPLLLDRRRDREATERWLLRSTAFRGLSHRGIRRRSRGWLWLVEPR